MGQNKKQKQKDPFPLSCFHQNILSQHQEKKLRHKDVAGLRGKDATTNVHIEKEEVF